MFSGCRWLHAPPYCGLISSTSPSRFCCDKISMATSARVAIVGDIHDDWNLEEDTISLRLLKPDLVLFTGDFGNENADIVGSIAKLDFPKAVILGNHDAWNTQKFSASKKDAVQLQLELLGDDHAGYGRIDFPNLKLTVVGGRPFSCGGEALFRKKLLKARYDVHDMDGSAKRIYEAGCGTPADHSVIFLAHNGPTGLGSNMEDICGRDWFIGGGDHGDPDLAQVISELKETTKVAIKLVVFGHMHKSLAYGGVRKMIAVGDDGIVYLNGAIVPRVDGNDEGSRRAFTVADILDGCLDKITETWVSVAGNKAQIEDECVLFKKTNMNESIQ